MVANFLLCQVLALIQEQMPTIIKYHYVKGDILPPQESIKGIISK